MSTATPKPTGIDTLTVSDDLHKAGFPPPQAKALAHWAGQFVTKTDLQATQSHLSQKIGGVDAKVNDVKKDLGKRIDGVDAKVNGVKEDLGKRIDGVKEDLGKRIDGVEQSLSKSIGDVKEDLGKRIDGVDAKVNDVKKDLGKRIDDVKEDLGKSIDGVKEDLGKRMDRLDENHKELRTTIAWNLRIMIGAITIAVAFILGGMGILLDRTPNAATATIEAPVTESASLIEPSGHEHDENRELSTPH